MKKIFAMVLAALAVSFAAQAQQRSVGETFGDGTMNFTVISLEPAEVEVANSPNATGVVEIPAEIVDYGITYKVTKVGKLAFYLGSGKDENPNISGVVFPEGLVEIGAQAFIGCRYIKELHFPSTLKTVGSSAFYCYKDKPSKLAEVWCDAVTPPTCGDMVFGSRFNAHDGVDRNIPLHVPSGSVQAYRDAKGWEYFNIISDGEEESIVDEVIVPVDIDGNPIDGSGNNNQALDNAVVTEKAHKVIVDGQLLIYRGNKVFDATGKEL